MCLAIPAQIEKIRDDRGTVVLDGSRTEAVLSLVPEAKVGDWVLLHAGYAITVLDPEDARATYDLLREMNVRMGGEASGRG
ncbi:MAG: HypC/HybG/HupF family hydrogenase formation chaperone [Planctomycetota bacterium]|nr:HypC/HybG/HupF family hydrogenase formation chaperone [Planctomycetota bacterium]